MHALAFGKRQQRQFPAVRRRFKARANRLYARASALDVAVMDGQMLGRRIGLADIHHQQRETHGQGRVASRRLVQRLEQMAAEIDRRGIIGDLRHAEQGRHLWQDVFERATFAQGLEHFRRRTRHQAARQFRPDFGRGRVEQQAGVDLLEHQVQSLLVHIRLVFGEQGGQTQNAETRMGLRQIRQGWIAVFGSCRRGSCHGNTSERSLS